MRLLAGGGNWLFGRYVWGRGRVVLRKQLPEMWVFNPEGLINSVLTLYIYIYIYIYISIYIYIHTHTYTYVYIDNSNYDNWKW